MLSRPKNSNHVRKVKKATDFLVVLLEDIGEEEERITVLYYVVTVWMLSLDHGKVP